MKRGLRSLILLAVVSGAAVHGQIAVSVHRNGAVCTEANEIGLRFINAQRFDKPHQDRMVGLWRWFSAVRDSRRPDLFFDLRMTPPSYPEEPAKVTAVRVLQTDDVWIPSRRNPAAFPPPEILDICLELGESLRGGQTAVKLQFIAPTDLPGGFSALPTDLAQPVNASVPGPTAATKPTDPREEANRPKRYERELDLMFVLLSSVKDKTLSSVKDKTEANETVRVRETTANGDLRLAPILNWKRLNLRSRSNLITFFTPFVATAKASNQPIKKDTLSVNQIVLGSEYEFRWYLSNEDGNATDNRLRLILKGNNTSDRDFKLNEAKGVVEFRPVLRLLFREIRDPKYVAKLKNPPPLGSDYKWGRTIVPIAGFETGNSYTRGRPAGDLQPVGAFQRGYFGTEAALNFHRRLILSTAQTFYLRGELDQNRWVHYSKNTVEWSFTTSSSALLGAAVYLTFEKGRLPPFNSAVNAVKLGIRMQSQGWTGYFR